MGHILASSLDRLSSLVKGREGERPLARSKLGGDCRLTTAPGLWPARLNSPAIDAPIETIQHTVPHVIEAPTLRPRHNRHLASGDSLQPTSRQSANSDSDNQATVVEALIDGSTYC